MIYVIKLNILNGIYSDIYSVDGEIFPYVCNNSNKKNPKIFKTLNCAISHLSSNSFLNSYSSEIIAWTKTELLDYLQTVLEWSEDKIYRYAAVAFL